MFDATKLLGSMMESVKAPAAQDRMKAAMQGGATAPANPLQSILASLSGGQGAAGAGSQPGPAGMLGNIGEMAQRAFGGTVQEVRGNNPVAVGGLGALAGALLGGGRGAVGGGLLAALGSLAFAAMQNAGQSAQAAPPASEEELHDTATLSLRAMIEAAKSDGRVDPEEMQRILGRLGDAGAEPAARDWVRAQLAAPSDLAGLAAQVRSPEQAAQVYGAALMAIQVDTPAERAFIGRLAQALRLPADAVAHINRALGVAA
jgi:uncharacterized membrane protein YebE (DUF533 family)